MKSGGSSSSTFLVWGISILALFILGIFGYFISKEIGKKRQVENEIENLKKQAEQIDKENSLLNEKIAYLSSEDYQEVQAKEKLNLQNPGESLIIVSEGPQKKQSPEIFEEKEAPQAVEAIPNYKKWWNLFFAVKL